MGALYQKALRKPANKPLPDRAQRREQRSRVPTRRRTGAAWKEFVLKSKELFGWLVLMPWCVFAFVTFIELLVRAAHDRTTWTSPEFSWFMIGTVLWLGMFAVGRRQLMILYVFAHELSHVIAAKLCGAVVYDWHVGRDGGWVDTNKSNTFISLAPYLVPLYSIGVIVLYGIAGLFVNLDTLHYIPLGAKVLPFDATKTLGFLIGFTWCFHFTYTLNTLRVEQSDVNRNGGFFSGWLILLCNLHIIAALVITASPAIRWIDGWQSMQAAAAGTFGVVWQLVASTAGSAWAALVETFRALHDWKVH
jgi:hypothetical protein